MTNQFFECFFDIIFGEFLLFGAKPIFSAFINESQPGQRTGLLSSARSRVNKNKKKVSKRVDKRAKQFL